jgi:hypothetical protein
VEEDPDVDLDGFPFVAQLLRRKFSSASMQMGQVRRSGIELSSVVLNFRNVSYSERGFRGLRGTRWIQIGRGHGRASLTEDALNDIVRSEGGDLDIALADGRVRMQVPACSEVSEGAECEATFSADGVAIENDGVAGVLVIPAPPPLDPIRITLPEIVDGFRAVSVQVRRDRMVMAISLRDADIYLRTGI